VRDDIHRRAPLSRPWKSLVRACENDASWMAEAPNKAEKAIWHELQKFSRQMLSHLEEQLGSCQMPIPEPEWALRKNLCPASTADLLTLEHLFRIVSSNPAHPDPIYLACNNALTEISNSVLRQLDGHLEANFPRQRAEMMRRVKQAIAHTPTRDLIQQTFEGKTFKPTLLPLPALTADEDLLILP
jgi:hypothetical protein